MADSQKETLIGGLVLLVGALFVSYAYQSGAEPGTPLASGYTIKAEFGRTDGLAVGSSVRLAGMNVGRVTGQKLTDGFRAVVSMWLETGVEIPTDSFAVIATDGIMGDKYIELEPGGELDILKEGDRVQITQDSMAVEELLAKIVDMAKTKRDAANAEPPPEDGAPPSDAPVE